jgi:hypothetical protein
MNNELKRMWKEAVVACFNVQSRHLPGGTFENHNKPHDSRSPCRDFNLEPPDYEQEFMFKHLVPTFPKWGTGGMMYNMKPFPFNSKVIFHWFLTNNALVTESWWQSVNIRISSLLETLLSQCSAIGIFCIGRVLGSIWNRRPILSVVVRTTVGVITIIWILI